MRVDNQLLNVGIYAGARVLWADDVLRRGDQNRTHRDWLERVIYPTLERHGLPFPRWNAPVLDAPLAVALVVRNCWIAQCPFPHCRGNSYEGIWRPVEGQRDFFFFCGCGNTATHGQRVAIDFRGVEPQEVENVLHGRAVAHTRNFVVGETVGILRAQNREHGEPELDPALPVMDRAERG